MNVGMNVTADVVPDVHAHASEYYSQANVHRNRTHSSSFARTVVELDEEEAKPNRKRYMRRRTSHDEKTSKPRKFLIDVEETKQIILKQEDTDGDFQITVNDVGPKVVKVGTADSGGFQKFDIRGTYMLSNLLQELALASGYGRKHIIIDEARLNENPVNRLSRMIRHHFWDGLTRRIDAEGLEVICKDPKNRGTDRRPRIYVPFDDPNAWEYYTGIAEARPHLDLQVVRLPSEITPQFVKSINDRPGILALATHVCTDVQGNKSLAAVPFVVPGGRFNEMYGWDSYFESLGLLADGRVELARGMVNNFVYQIDHYGKILNANRSYYLTRSQPPFLTDMALKVYERLPPENEAENLAWLSSALRAAIKEYHTVWMAPPRLDSKTGLSRFYPTGIGMPPETEASHFDHIIEPHAKKLGLSIQEYAKRYNDGSVKEPILDEYFIHDRAVRESGHDTTYRLEKRCAHLATIDLNALLYRYEVDLATAIHDLFDDRLELADGSIATSAEYRERAEKRRARIDRYCWDEERGLYFDYDTHKECRSSYETVTSLWTLWAGCSSPDQATRLVETALAKFEVKGGLVSGTELSRGQVSLDRPNRQWDYPYGWAPHQIMAWRGLEQYDLIEDARRLAYRWLYTITKSFVDFNGVVPEKFDIVDMTHLVKVEYGNVGIDFKLVPREGFGWMNASYQVGLTYLTTNMRRALGALTEPDQLFRSSRSQSSESSPSSPSSSVSSLVMNTIVSEDSLSS